MCRPARYSPESAGLAEAERDVHGAANRFGDSVMLATARQLGPPVRQHADQAERTRRLSPEVIAALSEAGLFRLLLPRSNGGLEGCVARRGDPAPPAGAHHRRRHRVRASPAGAPWRPAEPLCYTQIGGLAMATVITLLLVPVFYSIAVLDLKIMGPGASLSGA